MTPGPLTLVAMARAARYGTWAGMKVCLGHGIVEAGMVGLLGLGAAAVITQGWLVGTVSAVGALVLAWMGYSLLRDARRVSFMPGVGEAGDGGHRFTLGPVVAGMAATLGNPYWLVWWATVGVSYVVFAARFKAIGLGTFFTGHFMADVVVLGLVSLVFARGISFIGGKWYQRVLAVLGLFLIGLAGYFGFSAWQFWHGLS